MTTMEPVTLEQAREHGLSDEEFRRTQTILGRTPNLVELGVFSVLWSEHCSYKSSRLHLKKLPTEASWVLQGPGENAGIVDIGEGWAAAFKMESHNHPSFIEPFQGAATGVGGILRDVFTMGARPVACLDSLRFGASDAPRMRYLVDGVVGGIAFYGNCMGIPTVGGETTFYPAFDKNILVNAFALGTVRHDRIFRAYASGTGNPVIYVGSKTGRDGIHGATMASEEFDSDSEAKRPNVQVGDPFTEKLLMEACLELMSGDAVEGIQDMGAAGLTSSSFEMCGRAGTGMRIDLDRVPLREEGMNPYEIMLSESQERMLIVAKKNREGEVMDLFARWGLDAVVIGEVTDDGIVRADWRGREVLAIPAEPLSTQSPVYDRPTSRPPYLDAIESRPDPSFDCSDPADDLLRIVSSPNIASKRWIWRQYDHTVRTDTVIPPGDGAAVIRVKGTNRGIALTSDVNPLQCWMNPREGARRAVAEAVLNLACVGARPLGLTDCLNFGNPEKPEIMYQFVECVEGMAQACRALDVPVVSGNVSFYNETEGEAIWPTPTVAMVGLIEGIDRLPTGPVPEGSPIYLAGDAPLHMAGSQYAWTRGENGGPLPPVDLAAIDRLATAVQRGIAAGALLRARDASLGGLAVAGSILSLTIGRGVRIEIDPDLPLSTALFGECCGRVLLVGAPGAPFDAIAGNEDVPILRVGTVEGNRILFPGAGIDLSVDRVGEAFESCFPAMMEA